MQRALQFGFLANIVMIRLAQDAEVFAHFLSLFFFTLRAFLRRSRLARSASIFLVDLASRAARSLS